jgi:Na+:H+ antiporter, NhaA family
MPSPPASTLDDARSSLFSPPSGAEGGRLADVLRKETVGGALLLGAAVLAVALANSPWASAYEWLRELRFGPSALHLDLSLSVWAADGLLAIFFFVAGLELKREFLAGDLRDPRRAALPVAAAIGGVLVPSALYLAINAPLSGGDVRGWPVPAATDIAFALAVLAIGGRHLPAALRTFLLTVAVVDDLIAIVIIAVFLTSGLAILALVGALALLALFAVLVRKVPSPWLLVPTAVVTWALVHASGVHATVAGVLLAFTVPVARTHGMEHLLRPLSAGVAVPVFAFLAAGVSVQDGGGFGAAVRDPAAVGVVLGLVVGKPLGVLAATWLVARLTRARLDDGLGAADVVAIALLSGIGFTVSLLIGDLAFGNGSERQQHVTLAVLVGSTTAAVGALGLLRVRNRTHRRAAPAGSVPAATA